MICTERAERSSVRSRKPGTPSASSRERRRRPPCQSPSTAAQCPAVAQPSWGLHLTVSAGASNLVVNQWQLDSFDAAGVRLTTRRRPSTTFAASFNHCGPGSSRVLAQIRRVRRNLYHPWRRADERQHPGRLHGHRRRQSDRDIQQPACPVVTVARVTGEKLGHRVGRSTIARTLKAAAAARATAPDLAV